MRETISCAYIYLSSITSLSRYNTQRQSRQLLRLQFAISFLCVHYTSSFSLKSQEEKSIAFCERYFIAIKANFARGKVYPYVMVKITHSYNLTNTIRNKNPPVKMNESMKESPKRCVRSLTIISLCFKRIISQ